MNVGSRGCRSQILTFRLVLAARRQLLEASYTRSYMPFDSPELAHVRVRIFRKITAAMVPIAESTRVTLRDASL